MSGITQDWQCWCSSFVVGGVLIASLQECVFAQITPDNTLPNNSSIIRDGNTFNINGGTQTGANLFHSFEEFSIPTGGNASFNNAFDIQNIISRVTGGSASNIDGLIKTSGTANLFLINPNGIIFGQGARLDIGGSFVGTTADAIGFGNQNFFSAISPNTPELLSVNPSALLFNQIETASIQNNSVGLLVPDANSLLLVGGDINMDGGRLFAFGGRIELGGLAEPGIVELGVDSDYLSLKFPENVALADIILTNRSGVVVDGAGSGYITVNARNLEVLGETVLSAGIGQGLGTPETVAGNITLNATGEIKVAGGSIVRNLVRLGSRGNAGDIIIDSGSFWLRDNARLFAFTLGQGNAGNVIVSAKDTVSLVDNAGILNTVEAGSVGKGGNININAATLSLINRAQLITATRKASANQPAGRGNAGNVSINVTGAVDIAGGENGFSGIGSFVETGTVGNGGNITINSGSFSLRDDARLSAETSGQGNAGNVMVNVKDAVSLTNSDILSTVEAGGLGKGGNININAATLSLKDGAQLLTSTRKASVSQPAGRGDAGNVNINVTGAVDIAGGENGFSGIGSFVETGTVGNGGNITINSGSFSLRDDARLSAETIGQGNAGNVTVNAKDTVSLANNAGILSTVEAGGVGKSGNININASTLSLINRAQLLTLIREASATQPAGRGDAGNVNINVTGAVNIAGGENGFSGIGSRVEAGTVGNGGNITINSGSFSLQDGVQLGASTSGQGNAGNVTVSAKDVVSLADASILSTVEAGGVGKGGNIDINALTLSLKDGAQLLTLIREASATQPAGRGDAGNVNVNVTGTIDITGDKKGLFSAILSSVQTGTVGNGGNITINSGSFSLQNGAFLSASTFGQGNAGNVTVNALDAVSLIDAGILSTVGAGGVGKGGNIDINAATLSLINGAQLLTSTREASATQLAGRGNAGNVNVNVTGAVNISGEKNGLVSAIGSRVEMGTVGDGGNINIDSGSFSLQDGAQLSTSTSGQGKAGNVRVSAKDTVSLAGNAYVFGTVGAGGVGNGGNIDINAGSFSLTNGAQLATITRGAFATQLAGRGDAGNVNVNVTGAVNIAGEKNGLVSAIASFVDMGTVGNGGNITINSGSFSLQNGARLTAETFGQGNAGTIKVNAADFVNVSDNSSNFNSGLYVNSQSTTGTAGDIIVTSPRVTLDNSGRVNAESASGNGGNINLQTDLLLLRRGAQITTTAGKAQAGGNGGNINIDAPSGFIVAIPKENSDITANAFTGTGGRVDIQAFGIYGIQPRESQTLFSDITASSEFGTQGTVELNTPGIDPNSGLLELPTIPVDTEIAQGCYSPGYAQNRFVITGRGGLPANPKDILTPDTAQIGWVSVKPSNHNRSLPPVSIKPTTSTPKRIVEATGAMLNAKGQVVLSANSSTVTSHTSRHNTTQCHGR